MISPFYIFEVLEVPWRICAFIGIASLLIACGCLKSSYTSYTTYLKAQSSIICGVSDTSNCTKNCNSGSSMVFEYPLTRIIIIIIIFFTPLVIISYFINIENIKALFLVLISFILLISIDKEIISKLIIAKINTESNGVNPIIGDIAVESKQSSSIAVISFISSLFLCMIILASSYTPINLNAEPSSIKFNENIFNETTIENPVETLSLKNLGEELNSIDLKVKGLENNWLEIGYVNEDGKLDKKSNGLIINNISSGETKFVQIELCSSGMDSENMSQGSYIGSIDIYYRNELKSIPIYINLTKK